MEEREAERKKVEARKVLSFELLLALSLIKVVIF
jgi:hypothetical protein